MFWRITISRALISSLVSVRMDEVIRSIILSIASLVRTDVYSAVTSRLYGYGNRWFDSWSLV